MTVIQETIQTANSVIEAANHISRWNNPAEHDALIRKAMRLLEKALALQETKLNEEIGKNL
jgi:hypothetical protein